MPLHDIGTLILSHVVFLVHVVYIHLAFSHAQPTFIALLYVLIHVLGKRAEDFGEEAVWPPRAPKWL